MLNLANQYANNEMYPEALNSYQVIVKNKMFSNAGEQTTELLQMCLNYGCPSESTNYSGRTENPVFLIWLLKKKRKKKEDIC